MHRALLLAVLSLSVLLSPLVASQDASYTFTTIDVPGATFTVADGINDAGQIVGSYNIAGSDHGYLRAANGSLITIDVPPGNNGTGALGINNAGQIVGLYSDSSGTHGFVAKIAGAPATCPLGQGFWKTHPEAWPVTSLILGSQTYSQTELLTLLNTPIAGDASLILADQLIAAKLNLANGADPTPISAAITDADRLLSGFPGKLPYHVPPSSATGQAMVNDATVLESYNNGELTPECTP